MPCALGRALLATQFRPHSGSQLDLNKEVDACPS